MALHPGNARDHGALEILLQHGAQWFSQVQDLRSLKVQSNNLALLDEFAKRGRGMP